MGRPSPPWVRLPLRPDLILAVREGRKTVTRRMPRRDDRPPCRPGDRLAFTEQLRQVESVACYRADGAPVLRDGSEVEWPWRVSRLSARYCPNWAVRTWGTVVSVTRPRLGDMDQMEARREGFKQDHSTKATHWHALESFRDAWRQMHGDWDPDATPWRIEFGSVIARTGPVYSFVGPIPRIVGDLEITGQTEVEP